MIVSCPACQNRVRLDRNRYAGKLIKLRCVQCQNVFSVEVPTQESPSVEVDRGKVELAVLVAHSDTSLCDTVGELLSRHSIVWRSCHDGESALLLLEEHRPKLVLVDVALPGLFAFEVVDKIRKRPGLEDVKIILLSSVYNKLAYKRRPHSLYGADDYIEKHHIPTDLVTKIKKLVDDLKLPNSTTYSQTRLTDDSESRSKEERIIEDVNRRLKQAEEFESLAAANDSLSKEKAHRLARIIVSDIALYNQELVEEGIRTGKFFELLARDIAEGKRHFLEKIPAEIAGREEILQEAFEALIEHRRREMKL